MYARKIDAAHEKIDAGHKRQAAASAGGREEERACKSLTVRTRKIDAA